MQELIHHLLNQRAGITRFNHAFESITGYTVKEVVGNGNVFGAFDWRAWPPYAMKKEALARAGRSAV